MRTRTTFAVLGTATLLWLAPAAHAVGPCNGQNTAITSSTVAEAEAALLCLTNSFRAENGRGALVSQGQLAAAARKHSEDMVDRDFFSHDNLSGKTFAQRIAAEGYPSSTVGENIAVDSDPGVSARALFDEFESSALHRANMLDSHFTEIGIGIVPGAATLGNTGATVTENFGGGGGGGGGGGTNVALDPCARVATLEAKIAKLEERIAGAKGSERKKLKKKLTRARKALQSARALCG